MKDIYQVIIRPIVTEKSHRLMENADGRTTKSGTPNKLYTFEVHPDAHKFEIRAAIEELFSVKVKSVNTLPVPRRKRRVGANVGLTKAWKKAVVRLAEGQSIEIY